jgi:hypothetical protein
VAQVAIGKRVIARKAGSYSLLLRLVQRVPVLQLL